MNRSTLIGIITAAVIISVSILLLVLKVSFFDMKTFYFVLGIALIIAGMPFFTNLLLESKEEESKNQMFLEFARDLVEGVKSGTPISKSIINVRNKDYGTLSPYVIKLANQIALGIPVKEALSTFSIEVKSSVISRAIGLIREAEVSGGRIEKILESVSFSVSQIEKLKKERKAAVYNLTVQGYIIFFIFILIMLVLQFRILPSLSNINLGAGLGDSSFTSFDSIAPKHIDISSFSIAFLSLLITQGFFAGLIIGKISEGTIRAGLKHSFVLMALSWIIWSGANIMFR